ncbi:hypothetical protein [Melghirimyces profundicolus]|uniref:hypothetical protein n=1 Tax=Melghirimyces profundicolus TaxID=1242148 RepID=UPI000D34C201|nr:hypothetical protein [Melghirimyces profundicolus]
MSFFNVGEIYRDTYQIEHVEPFFQGELAVAAAGGKRFYLQYTRLQRPAPPRAIQQYLSLKHRSIVPYLQVYSEERSLVMIRPYVPFEDRLHERMARGGLEEERILSWVRSLFPVENILKEKPLRMYTLLHPANIAITASGELQVLYCGVEGRTLPNPEMDWGNLLYMLFSGNLVDEPIKKLPADADFPKPLAKLIQKSFNRPAGYVASRMDAYLKKRESKGLLDQLFKRPQPSGKEEETESREVGKEPGTPPSQVLQQRLEEARRMKEEQARQAREEAERQEREQRVEEEAERKAEEKDHLEAERRAPEERERLERERLEQEEAERKTEEKALPEEEQAKEEDRKAEETRRKAEQEAHLERARQILLQAGRLEKERREREAARRKAEEAKRLERERLSRAKLEREQHDRIAAQMEEYVQHVFNR